MREAMREYRDAKYARAKELHDFSSERIGEIAEFFAVEPGQITADDRRDLEEFFASASAELLTGRPPETLFHEKRREIMSQLDAAVDRFLRANQKDKNARLGDLSSMIKHLIKPFSEERYQSVIRPMDMALFDTSASPEEVHERVRAAVAELVSQSVMQRESGGMIEVHDIVHAMERYRSTGGREVAPAFSNVESPRHMYVDPKVMLEELYPTLFYPLFRRGFSGNNPIEGKLVPLILTDPECRRKLADVYRAQVAYDPTSKRNAEYLALVGRPVPDTVEERIKDYEQFLCLFLLDQAAGYDATEAERANIRNAFSELTDATRPPPYLAFARRVFSGEYEKNPRLFLEEFLDGIRYGKT